MLFFQGVNWKVYITLYLKPTRNHSPQIDSFAKLVSQLKSNEGAKFELECRLLILIYSNPKFKVTCKNTGFECSNEGMSRLILQRNHLNFVALHLPFYEKNILKLSGHPEDSGKHQMQIKMVYSSLKNISLRHYQSQMCYLRTTHLGPP